MVVLDLLLKEEGITNAHHDTTILLILPVADRALVALSNTSLVGVFAGLVFEVLVLVLVTKAALPLSAILFILFLEDIYLNTRQHRLNLARLATDNLPDGDTIIDLPKQLDVLFHVDVSAPAVSNAEEHLLELGQVHGLFAFCVVDPLLSDLTRHLFLAVEREQHLIDALHELHVLVFRDLIASAVLLRLRPQQLPELAADGLEVGVQENAALVSLGHYGVDYESCKEERA